MKMHEIIRQYKTNTMVRYMIMAIFAILAYLLSGGSIFTLLVAVAGLVLGVFSHNDEIDDIEV